MAALDSFERFPIWQRLVVFVVVAVGIVGVWFYFFYSEAVAAHDGAIAARDKANAEFKRITEEKEKFLERKRKQDEVENELKASMEVLPMSSAAVDNLMQTFQQQARLVGLTVETWTPDAEQKQDYYARMPVKVKASGTWSQTGEFFRRVSELNRPVSIEAVKLRLKGPRGGKDQADAGSAPVLEVEFEVTTYRFLPDAERRADKSGGTKRRAASRRRK